jgi:hypothetical protein
LLWKFKYIAGSFVLGLLLSEEIDAAPVLWPETVGPSLVLFTPHTDFPFVDVEGLPRLRVRYQAPDLDHYVLHSPLNWSLSQSCSEPKKRGSGHIQTAPFMNGVLDEFSGRIGLPIEIHMTNPATANAKERLLNTTLLTISALLINRDNYKLETHFKQKFTVRDLCNLDPLCRPRMSSGETIDLNLNAPVLTSNFQVLRLRQFRIRVDWTFENHCDDRLVFKVGDQIRILGASL